MLNKVASPSKWLAMLSFLFLCGCAVPAIRLNPTDSMTTDEGALVLVSHCPFKEGIVFEIHRLSGAGAGISHTHAFRSGYDFAAFKFPAGRYSIRRVFVGSYNFTISGEGYDFDVLPGRISYFGDFFVSTDHTRTDSISFRIADRQDSILNILSTRYPDLLEKYPLKMISVD